MQATETALIAAECHAGIDAIAIGEAISKTIPIPPMHMYV
jgi:hypothetical protein